MDKSLNLYIPDIIQHTKKETAAHIDSIISIAKHLWQKCVIIFFENFRSIICCLLSTWKSSLIIHIA